MAMQSSLLRSRGVALTTLGCLVLAAASARAETYQILWGTLTSDALPGEETGQSEALTGVIEASFFSARSDVTPEQTTLLVDDFAMQANARSFTPNPPIEHDGVPTRPVLEIADHILLEAAKVRNFRLRAGGEVIDSAAIELTVRFLDFRPGPWGGGEAIGKLADGALPRRLHLEGTLYEVDQTYSVRHGLCPPVTPRPPPPGGGVVVTSGDRGIAAGDLFHRYETFEIDPEETIELMAPAGTGGVFIRSIGDDSTLIEGELQELGGELFLVPPALDFGSFDASTTPTLEELGITAPSGAIVRYDDASGELEVTSEGDLFVEATFIDLPGLTSVTVSTPGDITITGTLTLPPDVVLHLEAGGKLVVEGDIDSPGGVEIVAPEIISVPICQPVLLAILPPEEHAVGSFSLVASAARPIEIDVQPWRGPNRVLLGIPQWIPVAILGSNDLDIREVDETSLRLGPGEAEPASWHGRRPTRRGYANRDRYPDLLARFDIRDTGIAYGDPYVCLVAETTAGLILEGCDSVETLPRWLRSALYRPRTRPARGR